MKHLILALIVVAASVVAVAEDPEKPSADETMAMYMEMASARSAVDGT